MNVGNETAIEAKQVTMAYEKQIVIDELNLSLPKGKITILIGANGCGKSTLLKGIGRMLKPEKGHVFVDHKEISQYGEKELAQKMAMLPQTPGCPETLTVRELIRFGRYPYQKPWCGLTKEDEAIVEQVMEKTSLSSLANRPVMQLSGGQRQRAWIAMTLAQEGDILLLDEPTTYLDMAHQLEILQLLQNWNRENHTTVVMVLHELNLACKFADHMIGMKDGKILFEGEPKEVITVESLHELYGIHATLLESPKGYPVCVDFS